MFTAGYTSAQYFQFVENKGQWDSSIKFKTDFKGGLLNLTPSGYRVVLHNQAELKELAEFYSGHQAEQTDTGKSGEAVKAKTLRLLKLHSHAYEIVFLNANENAVLAMCEANGWELCSKNERLRPCAA